MIGQIGWPLQNFSIMTINMWQQGRPIQIKLWKTPMERRPHGANGDSTSRRIYEGTTEKLGTSNEGNERSSEEDEEAV